MKVFIDTGAFCALTIPKDEHNQKAKSIHKQLKDRHAILYSSDYVLDEVYTLLKTRASHTTSVKFMDELKESHITILHIAEEVEDAAKAIFRQFEDRRLSFTDCTSFALINHSGFDAVFAFDEHFRYHPYTHHVEFLG
uniref:Nucleic acid-binding protein, contains PIN-like protein n=1 Tax=uncultured delta proteobacterium Rifle_16ft_4_minimus_27247 TaxID=1665177 RepID=A0A0H4TFG2_9DELT|nr:nucleic acid-binding protein, contains PIN-like protein [uncultured delta proteobacterium Rifle_16ft_4_minimus_27247]